MKSSTYTSKSLTSCSVVIGVDGRKSQSLGMQRCSSTWGGWSWTLLILSCPTSRAVSVAVQKSGGDSVHPIWRHVDTASLMGSFSCSWGRT